MMMVKQGFKRIRYYAAVSHYTLGRYLAERDTAFNDGRKLASHYPHADKVQARRFLVLSDHSLVLNDCLQLFYHYRTLANTPAS